MLRVTRQNYETWLRYTVGMRYDGTTLVVAAANDLACDWLSTRMRSVILQALTAVAGPGMQVRFEPTEPIPTANGNAPLQPSMIPAHQTPLNPRYTFDSLLEAGFNRLAISAARAITGEQASCYSPLFITGGAGSGKTHLLHAIAHDAGQEGLSFLLVSSEQFLSEYTNALRSHTGAAFRARYRDIDLLLVDDVQFLLGKKATLNEFYQTLAVLHDQGRRAAVAGDGSAMNGDASRFQGHLRWGLVASIEPASAEDRTRFVEAKAQAQGVHLPDEVKHYLALRVRSSLRDLEGAVNRVIALSRISFEPLTIDFTAKALQQPVDGIIAGQQTRLAAMDLLSAVSQRLGVTPAEITGPRRDRAVIYARHLAMYLLRQDAAMTYGAIAQLMGKKDHSTVVHACAQFARELEGSPVLRADVDAIRTALHIRTDAA
jgi:chromosomal replication initiator protein